MATAWTDWAPDAGLAGEVDEITGRTLKAYREDPNLITEHANHEESIRVGGYANRTLLELVQNAADAMAGADRNEEAVGRVEIVLDVGRQTLYCANAGRPLSRHGLNALAHAYLSGKRGDEIGRFGLGFKSVLAVTEAPQVLSRSISVEFNSPQAKAALATIDAQAKRFPVLRTPTRIDAAAEFEDDATLAELAQWAVTVIKLPHARKLDHLKQKIEKFRSEFLLFVNAVREIRLRVIGGDERFETRHVSRELGDGKFRIERPDGDHEEWYVEDRMHPTSAEARTEVGKAVARDSVKVTAAVPVRFGRLKTGEFWSYFPLLDRTSASALFNAPWSVNDDRTTLLKNTYNREILTTLSEMFVELLPKLATVDDPAGHLDYMPARGREAYSFGDEILCAHVPRLASERELIPDATDRLCMPTELRPLDLTVTAATERDHEEWSRSPQTGDDVPHPRCYANAQRIARLRQLYIHRFSQVALDQRGRDEMRALARMPKRGVQSWLREWAEGEDLTSAARALDFVLNNPKVEGIRSAKIVPTTDGMRAVKENTDVYLERVDDVVIERASFVSPGFLAIPGVEPKLRELGFRALDPLAVLRARLNKLTPTAEAAELEKFWDAVLGVSLAQARTEVARAASDGRVRVPTLDGGWSLPGNVLDIEGLGNRSPERLLDKSRCFPQVAYAAGVVNAPVSSYSVEDEVYFADYCQDVKEDLNRRLGPGERPIERIELDRGESPGPFSVLLMLEEAGAPDQVREKWTNELILRDQASWTCEDLDTGQTRRVMSPVRWAVRRAGRLRTNRGFRSPEQVVSASLVEYAALLPLFSGPRPVEAALSLPKDLDQIPATVLREALELADFPQPVKDTVLTKFVLTAATVAFPQGFPNFVPARVGRTVEVKRPDTVYVAATDEQQAFLSGRQKPYLRADPEQIGPLVDAVGCRRFEDSFSFSLLVEGRQDEERVIDRYTGLRTTFAANRVMNATVVKAVRIVKRVTTEDGVEDQSLDSHPDGLTLVVRADLDDRRILSELNKAFQLGLSNADLSRILQEGDDRRRESQRQAARAAATDAERLEVFFGPDTLKENLPKGLWEALEVQELVNASTSVAELFLTVYGSDSVRFLADEFRAEGYTDVPEEWKGRTPTINWLRKMGFGVKYAGRRNERQDNEFVVPGAVKLNPLHGFQKHIARQLEDVLTLPEPDGRARKGLVELPTGAGKTRVATQTVLRLFTEGRMSGTVLWIAQSAELCEQAVQTFNTVWRGLGDERPLTIGRLWDSSTVHEPDTQFSVIVATDAKLDESVVNSPAYAWLQQAAVVFVDEAHRAGGSPRYTRILRWLRVDGRSWERPLVGLSATPFKGNVEHGEQTRELAARFGSKIIKAFEGNAYEELSRLGVLSRVRHEVLPGTDVTLEPAELARIRSQRKLEPKVLDRIGSDQVRLQSLVQHILSLDSTWPILVFTPNVLSAQVLAATLRYRNVEAAAVSGQTGRQQRRDDIERFKKGEVRVLANCDLLIQGFDAPGVRALYIARPTFSPSAYIQMAGRGLRGPQNGGSEECLIVDVADNFGAVNDFLGYREYEHLWLE